MISVSIVNFNEGAKLKECLESIIDFADEIVVVDLGSSDNTKKICEQFKVKFFTHEHVPIVEFVRNFAISKTTGDWVLILDPDESLGESLKSRLQEIIKEDYFEVVNIPRKNIFFGKWISHTNWWPDRHIRFFKKGKVEWNNKIHSYPIYKGRILNLKKTEELAIIHEGYKSINEFLSRQNRYSTFEADSLFKEGERFSWKEFIWKPLREFLVRYLKHQGYLDGFYGFALTFSMMIYQIMVMVKLWEREKQI